MTATRRESKLTAFRVLVTFVSMCAIAAWLLVTASAAQKRTSRDALWEIVHSICVPGESQQHNPKPCLEVELNEGIEKGFAILKDPRGANSFLLTPTSRVSGIESSAIVGPNAVNYFSSAWEARRFINAAMHRILPRDDIGLAINSVVSRSQDQLHIHIACVRPETSEALHKNQEAIGNGWTPLNVHLFRRPYAAMWVSGEHLSPSNPFRLLAEGLPDTPLDMGNRTLVVIGMTRTDGTKGFVLLTDKVDRASNDSANGEELLDHKCSIATMDN